METPPTFLLFLVDTYFEPHYLPLLCTIVFAYFTHKKVIRSKKPKKLKQQQLREYRKDHLQGECDHGYTYTVMMKCAISFFTVIHDAQSTLRFTRTVLWLLAWTFVPFLSLFQSARMLREIVVTMDRTEAFLDLPPLLVRRHHRYYSQHEQDLLSSSSRRGRGRRRNLAETVRSTSSDHPPGYRQPNLHIVISHCDQPIDWIWKHYLWNQPYKSMTILSKCNRPPTIEQLPPEAAFPTTVHNSSFLKTTTTATTLTTTTTEKSIPLIQVLELPNVGRCDHSYAFWMAKLLGNILVDDILSYRLNFTNNADSTAAAGTGSRTIRMSDIYHSKQHDDDDEDNDVILFMKDNDNAYRANIDVEVPLHHMMESIMLSTSHQRNDQSSTLAMESTSTLLSTPPPITSTTTTMRFACGTKLRTGFPGFHRKNLLTIDDRERASNVAHRRTLWTFQQGEYSSSAGLLRRSEARGDFVSRYRPMGQWVRHLQYDLSAFDDGFYEGRYQDQNYDLVPVCFGGNFMTSLGTIQQSPVRNWTAIVESLSRGDNIEEGHYMERLWAHLFSVSLSKEEQQTMLDRTSRYFVDGAFTGMMVTLVNEKY
jgi:hypothetical protein